MNAAAPGSTLWRHTDFRRYWGGQAVTVAGFGITTIGTSVIAVVDLHASTMHVALIAVAGKLPPLLLSLHAGVLADRHRKRPIIISCDVLCALILASLPLAQLVAEVTLGQLYTVAFLVSALQVIGSNASISYLPVLLSGEQLRKGNSKLGATNSLADMAGNNLGGLLVTLLGAARAIALDALSYLICAFCMLRIRHREPKPAPRPAGTSQWTEIREGLDYTLNAPLVRSIVLSNATTSFALAASSALWSLYLLRRRPGPARALPAWHVRIARWQDPRPGGLCRRSGPRTRRGDRPDRRPGRRARGVDAGRRQSRHSAAHGRRTDYRLVRKACQPRA
ncbi:MFS family permease [Streptomyces candidus]|uniref:MFS family permease n=1 Tax=Streptomyces candidus TaxID=67283 RepID=A0A7X0LSY2_9ACTN|nr:MFS family permease [Streptomyces candidus]GHH56679.1 hypothetical protein GCM10018773_62990 [Streptomyces candidus]